MLQLISFRYGWEESLPIMKYLEKEKQLLALSRHLYEDFATATTTPYWTLVLNIFCQFVASYGKTFPLDVVDSLSTALNTLCTSMQTNTALAKGDLIQVIGTTISQSRDIQFVQLAQEFLLPCLPLLWKRLSSTCKQYDSSSYMYSVFC